MSARLLHVITRMDRGGSAENTALTVDALAAQGYDVTLAYGRTVVPTARLAALAAGGRVRLVEIPSLVREVDPPRDAVALATLVRLIRRGRFDLVHSHSSKAGILGRLAARIAGVPRVIHTPHGHAFYGYGGPMASRLFVLAERAAALATDRIVTLTDREQAEHLAVGVGRPGQFVTIPSGVDLGPFLAVGAALEAGGPEAAELRGQARRALAIPADATVVGSVGRLAPVKGHADLVAAAARLARGFPGIHVLLVGDGEARASLARLAGRLGLGGRLRIAGFRADVAPLLAAMDVAVFPSRNEGMGRAVVEAMAAGLPIIATRVGGLPEVLDEGRCGLLVEPGDPASLASAIARVLSDAALARRLAAAGRRAAARFGLEVMLDRIHGLTRELLGT